MKKNWQNIFDYKYIIISYLVVLFLLTPLFQLAQVAIPAADDLYYGAPAREVYVETGSFFKAVGAAVEKTAYTYKLWQGTYSGLFVMSLNPAVFSLSLYRKFAAILIWLTLLCPLILAFVMKKYFYPGKSKVLYVFALGYSFLTLQFMPSFFEGILWFNASWYYTFSFNLVFLMISAMIAFDKTENKVLKWVFFSLLILLNIFLGGTNVPQVLFLTVGYSMFILLAFVRKLKNKWLFAISWIVLGMGIAVNIFSPGNRHNVRGHVNLRYTALCMIKNFTENLSDWVPTLVTLAICILCIPFLKKLFKKSKVKHIYPAILGVASFLILLCMYTPAAFALNNGGPIRSVNVRMMMMQLLIYINVINAYGYYYQNLKDKSKLDINPVILITLSLLLLTSAFSGGRIMNAWSIKAEYSIMGLEVDKFASHMNPFFEMLEDESINKINVEPLPTHELLLPESAMLRDFGVGGFYQKEECIFYKVED